MKKYYIWTTLAIISIFVLQSMYINSIYNYFILKEHKTIEKCISQSIDIEFFTRIVLPKKGKVEFKRRITALDDMSQKSRDSLLAIHPLPSMPQNTFNLIEMMDRGNIESFGDAQTLRQQDYLYEQGCGIDVVKLDSIFNVRIGYDCKSKICLYNKNDSLLSCSRYFDDITEYNYESDFIPATLKDYQFIKIKAFIPISKFIRNSIYTLVLSLLIMLMPLGILILQITTIKRRDRESKDRELSINGVIHDLKSPLVNISAMLNLFRITETDTNKINFINDTQTNVQFLVKRIAVLLSAVRDSKGYIPVNKEEYRLSELIKRAEALVAALLQRYRGKNSNIKFISQSDEILYIDTMHLDTVIMNLVENSLKYSNNDIDITIELYTKSEDILAINVKDNGFGIKEKYYRKIFKDYFRTPHNNIEGYGLGLPYVRKVARAHNGDAYLVTSCEGKGSEFEVTFDVKKTSETLNY